MNTISDLALPIDCTLHVKSFNDLTKDELYDLLHIRSSVFIVEQNCVYQDIDYNDQHSTHLWLTHNNKIVAMCRICPAGTKMQEQSIGRVITTERGKGYGLIIMRAAIIHATKTNPDLRCIDIEAQADKQPFYEKLGFLPMSEPFMMEGLPHLHMRYTVVRSYVYENK